MANFNSTYFVIEGQSGEEFDSGGNSKTNGLYTSKGKAVQHLKRSFTIWETYLASPNISDIGRERSLAMLERLKAMKITEVKIVRVE